MRRKAVLKNTFSKFRLERKMRDRRGHTEVNTARPIEKLKSAKEHTIRSEYLKKTPTAAIWCTLL